MLPSKDRLIAWIYGMMMFALVIIGAVFFTFTWGKIPGVISFIAALGCGIMAWLHQPTF